MRVHKYEPATPAAPKRRQPALTIRDIFLHLTLPIGLVMTVAYLGESQQLQLMPTQIQCDLPLPSIAVRRYASCRLAIP